jgi:hypothetical protein
VDDSDEDQDYVGEDEDESESSVDGVSAAKITNRPQVGLKLMFFLLFCEVAGKITITN